MADSLNNVKILAVILFMLCSCERAKLQVPSDVVLQKDVQQHGTPKSVMETHIMKDPIAMKAHNLLTRVNNKIENFQNLLTDHRFAVEDPENGNKANILSPSKLKHAQLHLEKLTRLHSKMKIMLQKRKNQLKKMAQSKLKSTTTSVSNSKQIDTTTTVSPKHTTYISVQVAEPNVDTNQPSIDTTAEFGGNTISTLEQNQTAEQANVETTVQPLPATQPNQTAESKPTDKFTSQMKSKDFFTIIQTLLAELRNVTSPGTNPDDDHTAEKVVGRKNHKIVMVKFPAKEKKSGAQMNSKWDETFSNVQTTQNTLDSDNFVLTKNEEFYYDGVDNDTDVVDNDTDVVDNDTDGLDNDTEQKGN